MPAVIKEKDGMKIVIRKIISTHGMTCMMAVVICIALISCSGSNLRSTNAGAERHPARDEIVQYDKEGHDIVEALSAGDVEAFSSSIHKKPIIERAFKGIKKSRESIKAKAVLNEVIERAGSFMAENFKEHARLKFVRTRFFKDRYYALVRVRMGDGGLSYMEFMLDKDVQGNIRIIDWYDYSQGQTYSEYLRHAIILLLPESELSLSGLSGIGGINDNSTKHMAALARLSAEKKFMAWLKTYKRLPDRLKYSRIMLITRVLIANALDTGDEYRLALKDVRKYIGDDPSLSLMLVDHYLLEKDFSSAHKALDRLNIYTGGDAAIDYLRANISLTEKEYQLSVRYAQDAIEKDNSLEDAYWTLLVASIYSKEYDITVHTLDQLEYRFQYVFDPEELSLVSGYEEFAKSTFFAYWKDFRMTLNDR